MSSNDVRSAILLRPGVVQVVTRRRSPLDRGQVRVAVQQCGISDSDVRRLKGGFGDYPEPVQLGHEVAGKVSEVGPGVKGRSVGDRVAVWVSSWTFVYATQLETRGLADELVADARHCFPVGSGARFAFLSEPLGRLMTTLSRAEQVKERHVVIVGGGFKALLATMLIAERYRPRSLTVVSSRAEALRLASEVGATHTATPADMRSVVGRATDGHGADIAFELTGTQQGLELVQRSVCRNGELLVGLGLNGAREVNHGYLREQGIKLIHVGVEFDPEQLRSMAKAVGLLNGGFDPSPLIGSQFSLDYTAAAFAEAERSVRKVFVTP